jgi:hypothetical protein
MRAGELERSDANEKQMKRLDRKFRFMTRTGQAGPALTRRLVTAGWKVAVIERKLFGGTCVNTGCTPTKAPVASAYAAHVALRAADYGLTVGGPLNVDMRARTSLLPVARQC